MSVKRATVSQTIDELSTEACARLAGAPSARIGTVAEWGATLAELREADVVGVGGGLTVFGSAVAEKLQADHLDALFG